MLHQVKRAIEPSLSLVQTIGDWNAISTQLADAPRKRIPQLASYFDWPPNNLTLMGLCPQRTADRTSTLATPKRPALPQIHGIRGCSKGSRGTLISLMLL